MFGDICTSHSEIFEWHKRFSEDQEVVAKDERSGRFVTSRTGHVHRFCSILMASSRWNAYLKANSNTFSVCWKGEGRNGRFTEDGDT
ncbi:hypothetical protein TNCV_2773131 [Trichonephila clavipes]|nr:hypothetical protein TNCV_2773131 [Trichonephila clavipes]